MLQAHTAGGRGIHGNSFPGLAVILSGFTAAPVQIFMERDNCDSLIFRMNTPALIHNRVSTCDMSMYLYMPTPFHK